MFLGVRHNAQLFVLLLLMSMVWYGTGANLRESQSDNLEEPEVRDTGRHRFRGVTFTIQFLFGSEREGPFLV